MEININKDEKEIEERKKFAFEVTEKLVLKQGLGVVPNRDRRSLTGLRFMPIIEAKIGRKITDSEWESMSIR